MKSRPFPKLFLSFFLLVCSQSILCVSARSQGTDDPIRALPDRASLVRQSISHLHQEKYDSVFANSVLLREHYPNHPSGYLIAADAYQSLMRDYRVRRYEAEFDSLIGLTVKIERDLLRSQPNAEDYFILGAAEGYRGFHLFRRGQWLKAISSARTSIKSLQYAFELDSNFVDPLLGLAFFEYGQSKALGLGLDLFASKRQKAITMLKRVEKNGRYLSMNAAYALQLIYYESGEFDLALQMNNRLYQEFPTNLSSLYNRALLLEKNRHYQGAKNIWQELISRIEDFVQPSNNYQAECHYHLAAIHQILSSNKLALKELDLAERYEKLYDPDEEMDGPYVRFKEIRKGIERIRKKLK